MNRYFFTIILFLFTSCDKPTTMVVGGIYTIENAETKTNFGQYLILESKGTTGFYNFKSFDIENNEPVGKLIVALSKSYDYKEVKFDRALVLKAHKACDERMSQESRTLKNSFKETKNKSDFLKNKYKVLDKYVLNKYSKIKDSNFDYAIWLDVDREIFVVQIYSNEKVEKSKEVKWTDDPTWGISGIDQEKIVHSLDRMLIELEK